MYVLANVYEFNKGTFVGFIIANILFLLLYIFNTGNWYRNQLDFVDNQWIHPYRTGICGYGYGYGWEISYPRQPWFIYCLLDKNGVYR